MKVRLCSSIVKPRYIKIASETTPDTHTVIPSTIWNDPICTCPGFRFRETCKHVKSMEESRCDWVDKTQPPNTNELSCPMCGGETMIFDLEPEVASPEPVTLWVPPKSRVWCHEKFAHGPHYHTKTGEFCRGLTHDRT